MTQTTIKRRIEYYSGLLEKLYAAMDALIVIKWLI